MADSLLAERLMVIDEAIDEVRTIPCWAPRDDPMGGEFDLDGLSHRRFVLEALSRVRDRVTALSDPQRKVGE